MRRIRKHDVATRSRGEDLWDGFAQEGAEYYICTHDVDYSSPTVQRAFWDSGHTQMENVLRELEPHLHGHRLALELGCGIGRLAIPVSQHFDRVIAVDVAQTMLDKLAANCAERGIDTVDGYRPDGAWDRVGPVDFAYSLHVFQHIESWGVISEYLHRLGACIADDGVAYLHFDTRRPDLLYSVRPFLPDRMLPRPWKRGIRRVRRSRDEVLALARDAGFSLVDERAPSSADHVFVLKPSRAS